MYLKIMDNLVGQKFGRWTVLEARPNNKKGYVKVICECGKEKITRGRSIVDGSSKSCGCYRKDNAKKGLRIVGTNPARNKMYSIYRTKACRKNLEFELTIDKFYEITTGLCFYCSALPTNKLSTSTSNFYYNGIDRVDNSIGYTINNSVPCCNRCNTYKGAITKDMILKVYNFLYDKT